MLVALAERLRAAVRPADTVARLGGDEFVVVCEEIDERGRAAAPGAIRLAAAVRRARPHRQHRDRARRRRTEPARCSAAADAAAYRAKGGGGDRVELAA